MKRFLSDNFKLKLIALCLAIITWYYVKGELTSITLTGH
jgi:hypothetical protein